jgi:hypothetical protein
MAINLDQLLVQIVLSIIFVAPSLWISGRLLVGKEKAKFTDAIWIAVLGTVIGGIFQFFFTGIIAWIIMLIIWLALVKHFFDCGWLKALAISIIAVIIFIVIAVVIAAIFGLALIALLGL